MNRNKHFLSTFCAIFLSCVALFAQVPERISYQAVVRSGAANTLVTNSVVGVRVSILQGSISGAAVYTEEHTVTTNANGLLTLMIGEGSAQSGSFAAINWADDSYFVKTDIDPEGGSTYQLSSTTQLLAVPYALHSKSASSIVGNIPYSQIIGVPAGFSGSYSDLSGKPSIKDTVLQYGFSGNYSDLNGKPTLFSGAYSDLTDKPLLFSGVYTDLSGKPSIKDTVLQYGFSGNYSDLNGKPTLFSGAYSELTDKPLLFSGVYADLSGKPSIKDTVLQYGFSGNYSDLNGAPAGFSGSYTDLSNLPDLFSGEYADLNNKPTLFSGDYNDLTNRPDIKDSINMYGFSGDYVDLSNKPVNVSTFYNDADYITRLDIGATVPQGENDGDMLYWDSDSWNRLEAGLEGQILAFKSGRPAWIDFNSGAYKVGDMYLSDGVITGVIAEISADGTEGLLISLEEYATLKWGPDTTLTGAVGVDGYANTNLIRSAADYIGGSYPAVFTCVSLGADEWYLPSKEEMRKVYDNRNFINTRLEALGKTKLGEIANTYWTSTEKDADEAYLLQFKSVGTSWAGYAIEAKKDSSIDISVRAMRKLTAAEIHSRPDNYKFYNVGDVFYENGVPMGIVYKTSEGGLHGKVAALFHQDNAWSWNDPQQLTNAISDNDGYANMDSIRANVEYDINLFTTPPNYTIFTACLNANWYAPAKDELLEIYNLKGAIDASILQFKAQNPGKTVTLLDVTDAELLVYWSSTEVDADNAYSVSFETGVAVSQPKNTYGFIIGIRNF